MKVLGISGSPRKNGNTDILLGEALAGAGKGGAETELIVVAHHTGTSIAAKLAADEPDRVSKLILSGCPF